MQKESNSYQVRKDENSRKRSSRKVTKVGKKSKKSVIRMEISHDEV